MPKFRNAETSVIKTLGLPRVIIGFFFLLLCVLSVALGLKLPGLISDALRRVGMNSILVLAMVPAIQCGVTLNFGVSLGIVGGLLAGLLAIELGLTGFAAFGFALVCGVGISSCIGFLYGQMLNRVKGAEMTISTYAGFSMVSLMCIAWLILPLKNPAIGWAIGTGLRNTITLESTFGGVLNNFLSIKAGGFTIPTGLLLFMLLSCFLMWLFLRSKLGVAMSAAGNNPRFARASGINVDHMRLLGTTISTALGAVGILVYAQSFGFLQLYTAPLYMGFAAVASVLLGGASVSRAKVSHVIIGVCLFQGLLTLGLPVANLLAPEGNLSEILRIVVSNGIILFALTQAKGGESHV